MIHAIVSELEKKKVSPSHSIKQRFTILTAISSTMTRLLNLKKHEEVDPVEVDRFLYYILYCFDPAHEKPTQEALHHGLAEYLGPLSDAVKNKQIVVAACFNQPIQMCANACIHDTCKTFQVIKTSPPCVDSTTPAIDTHTGRKVEVLKECIKQESPHDNIYLMQNIHIGGSTVLLFYDQGSNCL